MLAYGRRFVQFMNLRGLCGAGHWASRRLAASGGETGEESNRRQRNHGLDRVPGDASIEIAADSPQTASPNVLDRAARGPCHTAGNGLSQIVDSGCVDIQTLEPIHMVLL